MKLFFVSCFVLFIFQFNPSGFLKIPISKAQFAKKAYCFFSYKKVPMVLVLEEIGGLTVMTICKIDSKNITIEDSCTSETIVSSNLEKEFCHAFKKNVKSFFEPTLSFQQTKPSCAEILSDWQRQADKLTTR